MIKVPLKVNKLSKHYGSVKAVQNVSFDLRPGEIFGLLGPNGAGKTSIISTVVTLERPTAGQILVFGHDVQKEPHLTKTKIGLVPQEIVNHGFFNVEEVLGFHSGYYGVVADKNKINYILNRLGLYEHRLKKVKQLSGGMKRRLLIAKALIHSPQLILLDEPTAGVDIELRESLWQFVCELQSEGVTILLTTHYLEEAERLCNRVGILSQGHLLKVGETKQLINDLTLRKIKIETNRDLSNLQHKYLSTAKPSYLEFAIPSGLGVGDILRETNITSEDVDDIKVFEGRLEEVFKTVVNEE